MDGRLGVPSFSPRIASLSIKGTSPLMTDEVSPPLSVCRLSSSLRSCGSSTLRCEDVGTHTNFDSDASLLPRKVLPCPTLASTSVEGVDIMNKRELLRAPGSVSLQETVTGTLKASWSSVVKQGLPGGNPSSDSFIPRMLDGSSL
ncbi:hypothetical protein Nepgr_018835 [Nepenthes gracilis]|uniref:Uncharacterized protein n=1 Tax=Nepenthes gracilis TaxID=150966 RepID=A0AAD3XUE5_NEPGR|nr:hypothetical protein Nepgr_018835 [Nepenthes gracilis]